VTAVGRRALLAGLTGALLAGACSHKDDVIVKTGADKRLTEADIDADPVRLLPAAAVGVLYVDMRALFASRFGDKLYGIAQKRAPLPAAAGFDAKRDLEKAWLGLYSMQGADVAGVAVGTFDRARIESAADGTATTPLGQKVSKTTYAKRQLYTAGNLGFSVLTARTALCGNDIGMRRALDRIEEGRARRQLPPNMAKLFVEPKTPIVGAADLTSSPLSDAARRELAFMDGVKTLSLVGNFEEPEPSPMRTRRRRPGAPTTWPPCAPRSSATLPSWLCSALPNRSRSSKPRCRAWTWHSWSRSTALPSVRCSNASGTC
jgi:hypothetical protein